MHVGGLVWQVVPPLPVLVVQMIIMMIYLVMIIIIYKHHCIVYGQSFLRTGGKVLYEFTLLLLFFFYFGTVYSQNIPPPLLPSLP